MKITRREFTIGAAATAAVRTRPRPAIAQAEPMRIGWLAALTGPTAAPAIGFNRGVLFAIEAINAAGGVKGRKIEIVTRDTQSDPTKAVNGTQELISSAQSPCRLGTDQFRRVARHDADHGARKNAEHPSLRRRPLIDPVKFPNAFRLSPSNTQWDDAVRGYTLKILKATEGRGDRRHHRLWRRRRESFRRGAEEGRRRGGLSSPISTPPSRI